jgi:GT2 family glycosyltransferase
LFTDYSSAKHNKCCMYDLIISVVTYNNPVEILENLLTSIKASRLKVKVIFLDNSNNESIKALCSKNDITYVPTERNYGFGKGHNLVLSEFGKLAPYFLICNPDIEIQPDALENLKSFMDHHNEVALSAPLILNSDSTIQYVHKRFPTPLLFLVRRFLPASLKRFFTKELDLYELKDQTFDRILEVPVLSGCFMFFRTSDLKKIGGFDERYFMYVEDIDICREASKVGKVILLPEAQVKHLWARGSYFNLRLTIYNIQSVYKYFCKWGPDAQCTVKEFIS